MDAVVVLRRSERRISLRFRYNRLVIVDDVSSREIGGPFRTIAEAERKFIITEAVMSLDDDLLVDDDRATDENKTR